MPSRRSNSRAAAKLSRSLTAKARRTKPISQLGGTKSSPMPSTSQEPASTFSPVETRGHAREEAAEPGQRAARADAADDGVEIMAHLLPDLGSGRRLMRQGIGRVGELIDIERPHLAREPLRHVLVVVGMALADIRARDANIGAQRLQMQDFLLAHLVGNDEDQAIAFLRRDERQAEAGIARGGFDQGAARAELAVTLRRLDKREPDPVLDRARGVLVLELGEEPARPRIEARKLDQGGIADGFEDGSLNGHDGSLRARRAPLPFLRPRAPARQGWRRGRSPLDTAHFDSLAPRLSHSHMSAYDFPLCPSGRRG